MRKVRMEKYNTSGINREEIVCACMGDQRSEMLTSAL